MLPVLPAGCRVLSTSRAGQSLWVETMRIEVELPDGSIRTFFKKVNCILLAVLKLRAHKF